MWHVCGEVGGWLVDKLSKGSECSGSSVASPPGEGHPPECHGLPALCYPWSLAVRRLFGIILALFMFAKLNFILCLRRTTCQVELDEDCEKRSQVWSLGSGQAWVQAGGFPASHGQRSSGYFAKSISASPHGKATSGPFGSSQRRHLSTAPGPELGGSYRKGSCLCNLFISQLTYGPRGLS